MAWHETVVPGEVFVLVFDLLPISYRFQKGHSLRVSISGADDDYFRHLPTDPPRLKIHRGPNYPSRIDLPVIEQQQ